MSLLVIRYNQYQNTSKSDYTKMYSKSKSNIYGNLKKGQIVMIVGSGKKLSGVLLCIGILTKSPVYERLPDELYRFRNEMEWKKNVWKFVIKPSIILNYNITNTLLWSEIKYIVSPKLINL